MHATAERERTVLHVGGLNYASEKAVVERRLGAQPGVLAVDANPVAQTATVDYNPARTDVAALRRWVEYATGSSANTADERIRAALETLRADPELSAARLAAGVHLSTSHFLRLFKRDTGTTLRRYRIWTRMLTTAAGIAGGADLTTASMAAGFASPSHFSAAFHATS